MRHALPASVIGLAIIVCLPCCSNSNDPAQSATGGANASSPLTADQQCSSGGDFGPPPGGFVQSPGIYVPSGGGPSFQGY